MHRISLPLFSLRRGCRLGEPPDPRQGTWTGSHRYGATLDSVRPPLRADLGLLMCTIAFNSLPCYLASDLCVLPWSECVGLSNHAATQMLPSPACFWRNRENRVSCPHHVLLVFFLFHHVLLIFVRIPN